MLLQIRFVVFAVVWIVFRVDEGFESFAKALNKGLSGPQEGIGQRDGVVVVVDWMPTSLFAQNPSLGPRIAKFRPRDEADNQRPVE